MAYIETRTLSVRKDRQKIHAVEPVYLRQGDCGMTIQGLLENNGQPFEFNSGSTGNAKATVSFKANNAGGLYLEETFDVSNSDAAEGIVNYVVSTALTQKYGKTAVAYFEVVTDDYVYTSDAIPIIVYKAADVSSGDAQKYTSELETLLTDSEQWAAEIQQLLEDLKNLQNSGDLADPTVTQTQTASGSSGYPILTKSTTSTSTETAGARFIPGVTVTPTSKMITASTFSGDLSGNATTATTATKLGSSSVGSRSQPIYLNSGTATQCDSSLAVSVTGNAATATIAEQIGYADVGSSSTPIYLSEGTPVACSSTLSVNISGNAATATIAEQIGYADVGSSSTPIYLSEGHPASCNTLSLDTSGNAATSTKLTTSRTITLSGDVSAQVSFDGSTDVNTTATLANSGIGSGSYGPSSNSSPSSGETFIVPYITFDAKGRATAASNHKITLPSAQGETGTADKLSCGNVGGTNAPVYFSDGVPKVLGTIGNAATPIYLDNGVLKECTELAMVTGLYLSDISLSNEWVASPGDSTTVTLTITNAGDDATNVTVKVANLDDDGDPDTHAAPDTSVISSINHGSSRTASFEIIAGSLFDSQTYFDVEISADGCATFLYKNAFKLDVGS